jgi:hypothetical protein
MENPGSVGFLTKQDLQDCLEEYRSHADAAEMAYETGIKYFRLPRLYATPSSGTVVLGESWAGQPYTGQITGPNQGYIWSIRRLTATGLGTGTSPDLLNIYRNGFQGDAIWQLNGNNWGYTFGPTEMILLPGEKLMARNIASLVSTSQITLTGDAISVPAEMIGKLVR